ncbi:MAG: SMC-Scp complex subunit ScpB [bacterium]|nr:SMC-Scp complex subunit ScpB [bacterium]
MQIEQLIEAILFFKGEPVSIDRLKRILNKNNEEIAEALSTLEQNLSERGIVLMRKEDEVMLATNKKAGDLIESLIKEELHKELGRAGLETLSIVLYLGPVSRSEIDYIRGVNSTFILRNLLIRGLIERIDNPKNKRSFLYQTTFELLSYLGVKSVLELPEYHATRTETEERRQKREEADRLEKETEAS